MDFITGKDLYMNELPPCPKCTSPYAYIDGQLYICPECAHEWSTHIEVEKHTEDPTFKDAYGTVLQDGDSVALIKDLKLKGSSTVIKVGTKVKNIHLVDGDHNIDCKIDGIGGMMLKSEFVKKI